MMKTLATLLCSAAMAGVAALAATETVPLSDAGGKEPWKIGFRKDRILVPGVTGLVETTVFNVPAEWRGRFVRFEIPFNMANLDAVLFLNGKRIGDILRPQGELDVSSHLEYGETNEVSLYCTFTGEGTDYGKCPLDYDKSRLGEFRLTGTPRFAVSDGPVIADVFANTSFRRAASISR